MKVLVACEFSGIVRDAFIVKGHDAWSVDLIDSEADRRFHIIEDALKVARSERWDMMIAFPPCTYLTNSANRWLTRPGRLIERERAVSFVKALFDTPIHRIAIENPVGALSTAWRKPSQIIQPFQFGHGETKATCLWLKNLPLLRPTKIVSGREARVHRAAPGKDRWKERSRTLVGVASAMADQWGGVEDDQR